MSSVHLERGPSYPRASQCPRRQMSVDCLKSSCSATLPIWEETRSIGRASIGGGPLLLPLAHRSQYVYVHIDRESLKNEQGKGSHPSNCLENWTSSIRQPGMHFLESGALGEQAREVPA